MSRSKSRNVPAVDSVFGCCIISYSLDVDEPLTGQEDEEALTVNELKGASIFLRGMCWPLFTLQSLWFNVVAIRLFI